MIPPYITALTWPNRYLNILMQLQTFVLFCCTVPLGPLSKQPDAARADLFSQPP